MSEWQVALLFGALVVSIAALWRIETTLQKILVSLDKQIEHMSHLHTDNKIRSEYLRGTVEEISYRLSDIKDQIARIIPDIDPTQPT